MNEHLDEDETPESLLQKANELNRLLGEITELALQLNHSNQDNDMESIQFNWQTGMSDETIAEHSQLKSERHVETENGGPEAS